MKLRIGSKVILKEHHLDSEHNLEIGFSGKIIINDGLDNQPYYVEWENYKHYQGWWVAEECIRPYKVVLENK